MKTKKLTLLLPMVVLSFCTFEMEAQTSVNAAGGNIASGASGSVSYSVGQTVYITNNGTIGSEAQGVQQPFEISEVLSSENFPQLVQDLVVFPNPTTNQLFLSLKNNDNAPIDYQIIDLNGKVLISEKNIANETTIPVENLSASIYFLKITTLNQEVKTFKIVKN